MTIQYQKNAKNKKKGEPWLALFLIRRSEKERESVIICKILLGMPNTKDAKTMGIKRRGKK